MWLNRRIEKLRYVPAGKDTVPPPAAAAAAMGGMVVDVSRHGVGLGLVPAHIAGGARVVDRIEHVEQLHRFVAEAETCQRDDGPERGMCVLPAVFAHTRQIAFDVTRVTR